MVMQASLFFWSVTIELIFKNIIRHRENIFMAKHILGIFLILSSGRVNFCLVPTQPLNILLSSLQRHPGRLAVC